MSERHSQSSVALDCEQLTCQVPAVLFIKSHFRALLPSWECEQCCSAVRCSAAGTLPAHSGAGFAAARSPQAFILQRGTHVLLGVQLSCCEES